MLGALPAGAQGQATPSGEVVGKAGALPKDIYPESGNRLPLPKREDMGEADRKIFDEIMAAQGGGYKSRGEDRPPLRLHSPGLAKGLGEAHHYLKYDTGLAPRTMEIAILTTARELTNQYEWTQWVEHAQDAKDPRHLDAKIVDTILNCRPVTGLDAKDAAVIKLGRETLGRRKVSPETFADVLRLYGRRGTVDLVELMALYSATGAELVAFDMQLNAGQKPMLPAGVKTSCGK
jgi:4-carboxymuconolactone decarboxylase